MKAQPHFLSASLILLLTAGCGDGGIVGTGGGPGPEPSANMDSALEDGGLAAPVAADGIESNTSDNLIEQPIDQADSNSNLQEIEVAPGSYSLLSINADDPEWGWQQLQALTVLTSKLSEIDEYCASLQQSSQCNLNAGQLTAYYDSNLVATENMLLDRWMTKSGLSAEQQQVLKTKQLEASAEGSYWTLGEVFVSPVAEENVGRIIETSVMTESGTELIPVSIRQPE